MTRGEPTNTANDNRPTCVNCGYDLSGHQQQTPSRCPECGALQPKTRRDAAGGQRLHVDLAPAAYACVAGTCIAAVGAAGFWLDYRPGLLGVSLGGGVVALAWLFAASCPKPVVWRAVFVRYVFFRSASVLLFTATAGVAITSIGLAVYLVWPLDTGIVSGRFQAALLIAVLLGAATSYAGRKASETAPSSNPLAAPSQDNETSAAPLPAGLAPCALAAVLGAVLALGGLMFVWRAAVAGSITGFVGVAAISAAYACAAVRLKDDWAAPLFRYQLTRTGMLAIATVAAHIGVNSVVAVHGAWTRSDLCSLTFNAALALCLFHFTFKIVVWLWRDTIRILKPSA